MPPNYCLYRRVNIVTVNVVILHELRHHPFYFLWLPSHTQVMWQTLFTDMPAADLTLPCYKSGCAWFAAVVTDDTSHLQPFRDLHCPLPRDAPPASEIGITGFYIARPRLTEQAAAIFEQFAEMLLRRFYFLCVLFDCIFHVVKYNRNLRECQGGIALDKQPAI